MNVVQGGLVDLGDAVQTAALGLITLGVSDGYDSLDGARLGSLVAGVGDLDGDGSEEMVIGAPFAECDDSNSNNCGKAFIVFGKDDWGGEDVELVHGHAVEDQRFWDQGVDEDELSTAADADGSLATDSGDRFLDVLGDFESAHDLATPWHDRPKVIARKMVRLIVNRALREKFPPPEVTFWQSLCGACVADERPKRRRRRKSRAR